MERGNNIVEDLKSYANVKGDVLKLKLAKGLSSSIAAVLASLLIIAVFQLVLIALTVALVILTGKLCGDYLLGALIATGVYLLLLFILILLRKKIFTGRFVKLLLKDENICSINEIDRQLMNDEIQIAKEEYAIRKDIDHILDWKRYIAPIVEIITQLLNKNKENSAPPKQETSQE